MPSDLRITDPHLISLVESEREKRGDSTATKTAGRLIVERLAQLEQVERENRAIASVQPAQAAR